MKLPNFKLKFQISQTTSFDTPTIIDKILTKLENKKYQIRAVTDNTITFRWNPFRLVWNFQAPFLLDGGDFEIAKTAQGAIVVLNYYINVLYPLLIIIGFMTVLITDGDYSDISFFGIFFLLAGAFQYITTKSVGKELLRDILTEHS